MKITGKPKLQLVELVDSSQICFKVTDSGIGINSDQMERIFQKFVQADDSATRKFSGSGLGLAICRRLMTLMGGNIQVVSSPGQGSTFTVTLPVCIDVKQKDSRAPI